MAKPGTRGNGALRRALELLKTVPMVDGHNDLPWVIRCDKIAQGDVLKYDLSRRHNDGDTDIPRLRQGRVGGQIWAAYVPTDIDHPARSVLEQIDIILCINAAHPNVFCRRRGRPISGARSGWGRSRRSWQSRAALGWRTVFRHSASGMPPASG